MSGVMRLSRARAAIVRILQGPVARGSIATLALQVLNAGLTFFTAVLLARLLGAEAFGAYSFGMAVASLLSVGASLGFGRYLVRETATACEQRDWRRLLGQTRVGIAVTALAGLAILGLGWLLRPVLAAVLEPNLLAALAIGLLLVPLMAGRMVLEGILRGLSRVVLALSGDQLVRPILFLGFVAATVWAFDSILSGPDVLMLAVAAQGLVILFLSIALWRCWPKDAAHVSPIYRPKRVLLGALPFTAMAGLAVLQSQVDLVMLGVLSGAEETGIYRAANRVASLVTFTMMAIGMPLGTRIAALYSRGDLDRMRELAGKASLAGTVGSLPIALALVLGGGFILELFGSEFKAGATALAILAVAHVINVAAGPAELLLTMSKHEKAVAVILTSSVVLNIMLNAVLIPVYGATGAATATGISLVFNRIGLTICVQRKLKMQVGLLWHLLGRKRRRYAS